MTHLVTRLHCYIGYNRSTTWLSFLPISFGSVGKDGHLDHIAKSMETTPKPQIPLTRYAWLSIAAAIITISMKASAYFLTNSVGLLSDALKSTVNLAAAIVALIVLRQILRPANDEFAFGYSKAEYFASGFEGGMILLAAARIVFTAIPQLIHPVPLDKLGLGLAISVAASLINLGVALVLKHAGKRYNSITLEADSRHLMTDVWTTAGVLVGMVLVMLTGYERLDAIIALLVAANIVVTGYKLLVPVGTRSAGRVSAARGLSWSSRSSIPTKPMGSSTTPCAHGWRLTTNAW